MGRKVDAKFYEGIWLELRMKSESIIGTPSGVSTAKTVRKLPEDQIWRAEEVLSFRGIPTLGQEMGETTSQLRSTGPSTHQHGNARSVTPAQQLPGRT